MRGRVKFQIECEQEVDGRWIAEVLELPGVLCYGASADDAMSKAETLALRALAEQLEMGERKPVEISICFANAA